MNPNFRLKTLMATVFLSVSSVTAAHEAGIKQFDANQYSPKQIGLIGVNKASSQSIHGIRMSPQIDKQLNSRTFSWLSPSKFKTGSADKLQLDKQLRDVLGQEATLHGVSKSAIKEADFIVSSKQQGAGVVKYQQRHNGIEVFGRQLNIMMDDQRRPVAISGYFAPAKTLHKARQKSFAISPSGALEAITRSLGLPKPKVSSLAAPKSSPFQYFQAEMASPSEVGLRGKQRVKKVFFPLSDQLIPAYYVEVHGRYTAGQNDFGYQYVVSAIDNKILYQKDMTAHQAFTYRVYADQDGVPLDSPFGNSSTPHPTGVFNDPVTESAQNAVLVTTEFGPISTQDPWLPSTATVTTGNNVDAYADIAGDDGFDDGQDIRPTLTSAFTFDYTTELEQDTVSEDGRNAAAVHLFYVNNYLHNWFYDNGFDELAGNAQASNYGRGGLENDRMRVEAQDNSGTNNANMSTPSDGSSPRMQMYLFTSGASQFVSWPGQGEIQVGSAGFGEQNFSLSGIAARFIDNDEADGGSFTDGCSAATNPNELVDRIAVIDRGTCNFSVKVKNAQDAGAIAALVVNDTADDGSDRGGLTNMGGDDTTVTIPSLFMRQEEGSLLLDDMANGDVEVTMERVIQYRDGTLDTGIIAHEWAHYLSNRLVVNATGLVNSQGRGMGEGWSDFLSLLLTVKEQDRSLAGNDQFQAAYSVASYSVRDVYFGIRRIPYSTDFDLNALTYRHIILNEPLPQTNVVRFGSDGSFNNRVHQTGEVWSTSLWEFYVELLNRSDLSFTEAQDRMKTYLVDSLKMTPYAPTMLEARDALWAAVAARDAQDFALAVEAFARRGMGLNAVAADRFSETREGAVEDFTTQQNQFVVESMELDTETVGPNYFYCDNDGIWDIDESAKLTVTIRNNGTSSVAPVTPEFSSSANVTFDTTSTPSFGAMDFFGDTSSIELPVVLNSAGTNEAVSLSVSFPDDGAPNGVVEPLPTNLVVESNFDMVANSLSSDFSSERAFAIDYNTSTTNSNLGPFVLDEGQYDQFFGTGQMVFGDNQGSSGAVDLETPMVTGASTGDVIMSFFHYYEFEEGSDDNGDPVYYDAGVIEVSIDGGAWQDVVEAGATLSSPYTGTVDDGNTILAGRSAYAGLIPAFGETVSVTFPDGAVNGSSLQFRFRIATDASVGAFGWLIDDVSFSNVVETPFSTRSADDGICENVVPYVLDIQDFTVSEQDNGQQRRVTINAEAGDVDGSSLTYRWQQTSGVGVTIEEGDTTAMSFTVPRLAATQNFGFTFTADDGEDQASKSVTVTVEDVNETPSVDISGPATVVEGRSVTLTSSVDDDDTANSLTFSWRQLSNLNIDIDGSSSGSTFRFNAPNVSSDQTIIIELTVSDGELSATEQISITVENQPESSSGGGSLGLWISSLLTLLFVLRRRQRLAKS